MKKKFSIVIACFNSEKTIKCTLKSIINQTYKNWEIIIIDNKSKDRTLQIVRRFQAYNIKIFSSKDKGIYDAINKGIKLCSGDIISILHSNDFYNDNKVLDIVAKKFSNKMINIVHGNLFYVKKNNIKKIARTWIGKNFNKKDFLQGLSPPHLSFFVKRKTYLSYGLYKNNLGNPADVELMYNYLIKYKLRNIYVNYFFVKMRLGGTSNRSLKNIYFQNLEILKFLKINLNLFKIIYFFVYKFINRLKQIVISRYYI